jgi:glycine/D-amino acid oxidase-like deaminating enzyme
MNVLVAETDVLVLGGGLAAAWAAAAAAGTGVEVVLADKGFCGTSGVTATAGTGHWWVPPDPGLRGAAIRDREAFGEGLAERRWMARVLDETCPTLPTLAAYPRRHSGWGEWRDDPAHTNESWRMDEVYACARETHTEPNTREITR